MYGKPARVDAYFAKTTRRNTDNFWHGGENNRPNETIDNFQNGKPYLFVNTLILPP